MAQKQVQACKTLVCYTVDSDDTDDSDEDEEGKEKAQQSFGDVIIKEEPGQQDFGDIRIKEEPEWCMDTEGYIEPQDKMVVEFSEPQVKVEIVSESEESSDESSSESSSEEEEEAKKKPEKEDDLEKDEGPPRTKNEIGMSDLPPVKDLDLKVSVSECQVVGHVSSVVDQLLVIESVLDQPALDLESVLFVKNDSDNDQLLALGRVFDVIGPVTRPYYCIRFNDKAHVESKNLTKGQEIFFAPKTEHTSFVFLEQLMKMKISDASWCNDEEPPPDFQEYSDDEQESLAKQNKKLAKMVEKGADPQAVQAKKARMEQGRARQDGRATRALDGAHTQGPSLNPRHNNGLYGQHVNPFYRQQRSYDPRAMGGDRGIRWGDYGVGAHYRPPPPPPSYIPGSGIHPVHQYHHQANNAPYNPYSVPPPPIHASTPSPHHTATQPRPSAHIALQGGSWGSQYQTSPSTPSTSAPPSFSSLPPPPPPPSSTPPHG